MSLVIAWIGTDFIAAAGDGRLAQKHADGSVTPIAEDFLKILASELPPGMLV